MKKMMNKTMTKVLATAISGCMLFSFASCTSKPNPSPSATGEYSYLAIDINPSIELVVDGETVVKVKACNEDAAILLSGESFEGMNVETVSQSIVELAEELGYLTVDNDGVKITVSSDDAKLEEKLCNLAKKGAELGSRIAQVNFAPRWSDERKLKELQATDEEAYKNLTPSKLRLIEAIMLYDDTMTYEKGANMTVNELADMLDDLAEEYEDIVGEELENSFKEIFESAKTDKIQGIVAALGDAEYSKAWAKYVSLKGVAKVIEEKAKATQISEEDINEILSLLGTQKPTAPETDATQPAMPNGGGMKQPGFPEDITVWNEDKIEDYIDKHFRHLYDKETFEAIEEKIEEILDKYDEDEYVLTEADLEMIAKVWGEELNVVTLGDLEEFLEAEEDRLEARREEIFENLDGFKKEIIEGMMNKDFEISKKELQGKVEKAKEEWKQKKEELRKNGK